MKDFTKEQGLEVQKRNLEKWEIILKAEVFDNLKKWCEYHNEKAKDGYEVKRGSDLTDFIVNF